MSFPLDRLPPEIIHIVLRYVNPADVISLTKCLPVVITEEVYHHAFHDDTHFTHYDLEMFRARERAHLFVVGDRGDATTYLKILPCNYELLEDETYRRMHTPWKIRNKAPIVKASLMPTPENAVLVLDTDENIYLADSYPPISNIRPWELKESFERVVPEDDFEVGRFRKERMALQSELDQYQQAGWNTDWLVERMNKRLPPPPAVVVKFSNMLFSRPYKKPHFVQVLRSDPILAQDDTGLLWFQSHYKWVPLLLVENESLVTGRFLKGWNYHFLVEGRGVVQLDGRLDNTYLFSPNGVRNGYPCLEDYCCYMTARTLEDTESVVDIHQFEQYLDTFLRSDGKVYTEVEEGGYTGRFPDVVKMLKPDCRCIQIEGCWGHAGFLASDGVAGIADIQDMFGDLRPGRISAEMVLDIPARVVSIALGWSHGLALTDDGDVYVFGREGKCNGCLGLGKFEEVLKMQSVKYDDVGMSLSTLRPIKLKLPGKAYAVYADNSYSAFLIDDGGQTVAKEEAAVYTGYVSGIEEALARETASKMGIYSGNYVGKWTLGSEESA